MEFFNSPKQKLITGSILLGVLALLVAVAFLFQSEEGPSKFFPQNWNFGTSSTSTREQLLRQQQERLLKQQQEGLDTLRANFPAPTSTPGVITKQENELDALRRRSPAPPSIEQQQYELDKLRGR